MSHKRSKNDEDMPLKRDGHMREDNGISHGKLDLTEFSAEEKVRSALIRTQEKMNDVGEIRLLIDQDPAYKIAREKAVEYLSYRPRSSGKVREKLISKEHDATMATQVVADLVRDGYIDDYKIAIQLIKERSGQKAESYRLLYQRLLVAGIPKDTATKAVAEAKEETAEILLLAAFLKHKFRKQLLRLRDETIAFEEVQDIRIKIIKTAERRGFSITDVRSLLRRWFPDML